MRENDTTPFQPRDVLVALGLLSRLPLRLPDAAYARGARAAWAYPLAGAVLGGGAALVATLALSLGLPTGGAALLALVTLILLSGAMHEDGLADCADGFWGGWERARRLEIMKDSQIGTYGVIALVLSLLARWWALSLLLGTPAGIWALPAVAMLSRAGMPVLMCALPHARQSGLSHAQGRVAVQTAALAVALALGLSLPLLGWQVMPLALLATAMVGLVALLARRKIGGQTGDVLGASQQLSEVALLLALI